MLCEGQTRLGGQERDSLGLASQAEWKKESVLCEAACKKRNQYCAKVTIRSQELPEKGLWKKESELKEKKFDKRRRHLAFATKGLVGMPDKGLVVIPAMSIST